MVPPKNLLGGVWLMSVVPKPLPLVLLYSGSDQTFCFALQVARLRPTNPTEASFINLVLVSKFCGKV